jgi:hypothetical protein
MNIDPTKFPQLARMQEVQEASQAIGEFLEWLSEQRIDLCSVIPGSGHDRWAPITDGAEKLLARYFDVDLNAVERERRAVLAACSAPGARVEPRSEPRPMDEIPEYRHPLHHQPDIPGAETSDKEHGEKP